MQTPKIPHTTQTTQTRRQVLGAAAAGGALALLGTSPTVFAQAGRKIRIGYVSPQTGPLAGFGEVDRFVLAGINGVPCISTTCPWQPWFFGRGGDPKKGFEWAYHFFWGLEDVIAVFTNVWKDVPTNKVVGLLLANDGDGNAWGDAALGLPPALKAKGYTVVDPGRYQPFQSDFSAQISAFKKANVEIVCGVPTPPDFKNFWTQARQQGFKPKVVTMGKAITRRREKPRPSGRGGRAQARAASQWRGS